MSDAPSPRDIEAARLAALAELDILDTPQEREFDELTRLAAAALGVASAAVSLVDDSRQWFKSRHGIPFCETSREIAFCDHAVVSRSPVIIPDARLDPRFASNPLVTSDGGIRFYAGMPLIVSTGHCLGTLCVFDPIPRAGLTSEQEAVLRDLAGLATDLIESRRFRRMGEIAAKVVEATSDAVLAADRDGTILYWNAAASLMFGRSIEEALGQDIAIIIPSRLAQAHRDGFAKAAAGAPTRLVGTAVELCACRADGEEFPIELSLARWGEGEAGGFAAIIRDISKRTALEAERAHAQVFLDSVVSNLPAMLFVKDAATRRYLMVNKVGERVMGLSADEIVGATDTLLFPAFADGYRQRDDETIATGHPLHFESEFVRDDGDRTILRTTRTLVDGPDRAGQYILGISEDVTQIRKSESDILRLAHYDELTGSLNRRSHTERLHNLVRDDRSFALLSIDLDRFKSVNDQFGHLVGDDVLAQVGARITAAIGLSAWVARTGGDEFVAVLEGEKRRQDVQKLASHIVTAIHAPFASGRIVAHIGASVGFVLFPEDGTTIEQIRENADLALYRAKQSGKGSACSFSLCMDTAARDRRKLEADLRTAVINGEIGLAYQPVVSATTGLVTSAEALARWTHPVRGPIRPDIFIGLAEECGLIDTLGEQLLRQACMEAQSWPEQIRIAVNLSPLQFLSGKLPSKVQKTLDETRLNPDRLQLEVTEGLVIRDVERTFRQLEEMRSIGIQVLIDDFGVGYSSLSYFQRFKFDKVKIDKSFVDNITTSFSARAIVQAVVGLGQQLGMGVVAEGVETDGQMRSLVDCGCTHLQGYLFSAPVAADAMRTYIFAGKNAENGLRFPSLAQISGS